ncbi:MAG: hypothetical protein P4L33_20340 [Capsulimonadaceae bacterium]|nr:hypothetical protein [Capsulimonadaceae bacterium]
MIDLTNTKLLRTWTDPESGVASYVLNNAVAPYQQSFYFANRSLTDDCRYLWFYCSFPPAGDSYNRTLGVWDTELGAVNHYPETQCLDASPLVDTRNGEVYWCNRYAVWKRAPKPAAKPERVAVFPAEWASRGVTHRMATHLTFSVDRKELSFDAEIGNHWFAGSISVADGAFNLWAEFDRCYNHAQFHPHDPDELLIAQDYWTDKATGEPHGIDTNDDGKLLRMWTLRRDGSMRSWLPNEKAATHEWWSADGRINYVDWNKGVMQIDCKSGRQSLVDPGGTWHAHDARDGRLFVHDSMASRAFFRGGPANVGFFNRDTGRSLTIAHLPASATLEEPSVYHPDPHPNFVGGDRYIVYTTTVFGALDVALTPVAPLLERTSA